MRKFSVEPCPQCERDRGQKLVVCHQELHLTLGSPLVQTHKPVKVVFVSGLVADEPFASIRGGARATSWPPQPVCRTGEALFVPSSPRAAALLGGRRTNRRLPFIRPFYSRASPPSGGLKHLPAHQQEWWRRRNKESSVASAQQDTI